MWHGSLGASRVSIPKIRGGKIDAAQQGLSPTLRLIRLPVTSSMDDENR